MRKYKLMKILSVIGSPRGESVSVAAMQLASRVMSQLDATVHVIDLRTTPLPLYSPVSYREAEHFALIQQLVEEADGYLLATPDYHGSMSGILKNFLDHFWHEFAGKMFGIICASHEKGLTAIDQVRTAIRQCYGWALPYGVSLSEHDVDDNGCITTPAVEKKLRMLGRDLVVYGSLIRDQRRLDLENGEELTFMAKYRNRR